MTTSWSTLDNREHNHFADVPGEAVCQACGMPLTAATAAVVHPGTFARQETLLEFSDRTFDLERSWGRHEVQVLLCLPCARTVDHGGVARRGVLTAALRGGVWEGATIL